MYASISQAGTTVTSGAAASAGAAIPNSASGTRAKWVRVTGSTLGYIKFGAADTVAATTNDILVTTTPSFFFVGGQTHYSVIQETAACKINIVPVDV